jgi:hypothetical protein
MSELATVPNAAHIERVIEQVMPRNASQVDRMALAAMMKTYGLDPLRREVYPLAFGGRLCLYVSIDGWRRLARESGRYHSGVCIYHRDAAGTVDSCTFKVSTTEGGEFEFTCWLSEFKGSSPNWRTQPLHMLRTRAEAHCLKAAFGFSGATEGDEELAEATSVVQADSALAALNARVSQSAERTTVALPSSPPPVVEQSPPAASAAPDRIAALAEAIADQAKSVGIRWSAKQAVAAARKTVDLGTDPSEVDGLILKALQVQAARLEKGSEQ